MSMSNEELLSALKSEIDQRISKSEEEIKRHNSVLQEDFKKDLSTIGEQYNSIIIKLDKHDEDIQTSICEFQTVKDALMEISKKVDMHEKKLSHL